MNSIRQVSEDSAIADAISAMGAIVLGPSVLY